jgi:beta-lactamase class D
MIETVVALIMFIGAEIKEHRIQDNMAACLRGKRHAERQYTPNVTYKCKESLLKY